jgi:hypothetical protein
LVDAATSEAKEAAAQVRRPLRAVLAAPRSLPFGEVQFPTPEEADATRTPGEGQVARPWNL